MSLLLIKKYSKIIVLAAETVLILLFVVININIQAGIKTEREKAAADSQKNTLRNSPQETDLLDTEGIIDSEGVVLSEHDNRVDVVPTAIPTSSPVSLPKKEYVIAAIGDSMVETMGNNLDYLASELKERYPSTNFKFYNYGLGSENVISANNRFFEPFSSGERNFLSIANVNADVIIVGSYSYNPIYPYDKDVQLLKLSELLSKAKTTSADIYLLSEIAPLKDDFGVGVGGIDWPADKRLAQAEIILGQLNLLPSIAKDTKVGYIDAFTESRDSYGYGLKKYVDGHDGIHPSIEGHKFIAKKIAETVKFY